MNQEKSVAFNKELDELLKKYEVTLKVANNIVIVPVEKKPEDVVHEVTHIEPVAESK